MTTEQKMKEIFVVDGGLEITPVQVPLSEWENSSGCFTAKIGSQPIIVLKGGWSRFTTYGGFETREEAEKFKSVVKKQEKARTKGGEDKSYPLIEGG